MLFSSISCGPIPLLSERNSNTTQMRLFSNDSNIDEEVNGLRARTLNLYSIKQVWVAEGEMKVAFLKFLIFKLKIMIKLVSQIFGLKPYSSHQIERNLNQNIIYPSEQYPHLNDVVADIDHNDYNDLQFNLLPEDFQARSKRSLQILINWFTRLGLKLKDYFKI